MIDLNRVPQRVKDLAELAVTALELSEPFVVKLIRVNLWLVRGLQHLIMKLDAHTSMLFPDHSKYCTIVQNSVMGPLSIKKVLS